jgi:hypothetical protein
VSPQVSQTTVAVIDVNCTELQTWPALPPSGVVPIRPTVRVTWQATLFSVPHENVAFAPIGLVIAAPAQSVDHWMVSVPPLPALDTDARAAVWGGKISAGLMENEAMPGHTNAGWFAVVAPASMATVPVVTSAETAASVGTKHVIFDTTLVMAPAATENVATVPEQKSPALSDPVSVQEYPPPTGTPPTTCSIDCASPMAIVPLKLDVPLVHEKSTDVSRVVVVPKTVRFIPTLPTSPRVLVFAKPPFPPLLAEAPLDRCSVEQEASDTAAMAMPAARALRVSFIAVTSTPEC